MTTFAGKEGTVDIGANTLAELNSFTINQTAETADDTTMGDAWRSHKVTFKTWSGSLECWWDDTDTNGQESLTVGSSVTINAYPENSTTGNYLLTGTATVTAVNHSQSKDGIVERSFDFLGNGALTISTAS